MVVTWVTLSPQAKEGYPYFPGQEATLRGDADFLLEVSESENFRNGRISSALAVTLILVACFVQSL